MLHFKKLDSRVQSSKNKATKQATYPEDNCHETRQFCQRQQLRRSSKSHGGDHSRETTVTSLPTRRSHTARAVKLFREHLGREVEVFSFSAALAQMLWFESRHRVASRILCAQTSPHKCRRMSAPEKIHWCKLCDCLSGRKITVNKSPCFMRVGFEHHVQRGDLRGAGYRDGDGLHAAGVESVSRFAMSDMLLHVDGRVSPSGATLRQT